MKGKKTRDIIKDEGAKIPPGLKSGVEALFSKSIEEMRKELDTLYGKAVSEEDYLQVMTKADELNNQMWAENKDGNEIAEAIYNGLFGNYYWVRKFAHTSAEISIVRARVELWYKEIDAGKKPELKIKYGYLLAVILSELADDFAGADKIRNEMREIAEKSGDILSIFRLINADGLKEMKIGLYKQAIKTFGTIEDYGEIHPDAFRNAGNIYSNRGAANIRGGIDALAGAQNLLKAANYYLQEDEPPRKHLQGVMNRFREAIEDLAEELGRGDSLVSSSRGENL
jgi:hypothetical protein